MLVQMVLPGEVAKASSTAMATKDASGPGAPMHVLKIHGWVSGEGHVREK